MFRKSLIAGAAALMTLAVGSANAAYTFTANGNTGYVETGSVFDPTGYGSNVVDVTLGSAIAFGTITTDQEYLVTYTFLGSEAGYTDTLSFTIDGQTLSNKSAAGTSVSVDNAAGFLNFLFKDQTGATVTDAQGAGLSQSSTISWALLQGATTTVPGTYTYILGFNDSAPGLTDYDDMVVGITLTAVPEPEAYALMLAGLGCMAFVGRRRKQD